MGKGLLVEIASLLVIAAACVWLFHRLRLPPILAYLVAGLISGPYAMGIITDPNDIHLVAEFGVVFLLFSLGLEFSLPKLMAMRHWVLGAGSAQVLTSILFFMGLAMLVGVPWQGALAIGGVFALSSTAIVLKLLNQQGLMNTERGQLTVSILLFQDIAVVPLLIIIPLLASNSQDGFLFELAWAMTKGALVFFILLALGKSVLPKVFDEVARVKVEELFVLTALLVAVFAGGFTYWMGLSMALGAFLAGMTLAESQYKHQLEADIRPFRDILLGIFFTTVGMQLDPLSLIKFGHWILLVSIGLLVIKTLIIHASGRLAGASRADSWATGLMLSQMGEFGFLLAALALKLGMISPEQASVLIGVGCLTMAITPFFVKNHEVLVEKLGFPAAPQPQAEYEEISDHVVICGFGRVGQTAARFLRLEGVSYRVIDSDPMRCQQALAAGELVHFGDARKALLLKAVSLPTARLVIITMDEIQVVKEIIYNIRQQMPSIRILVRTRDDDYLDELKRVGADEVIPETLEGSLMLVSQVLFRTGVPMGRIFRRVQQERKNHYGDLHGFFPGHTTDRSMDKLDRLEFLHAVALPADAFAIGMTVQQLELEKKRVFLYGLRREGKELTEPEETLTLKPQDVLILKGKPRRVERAERYLLEGD